MSISDKKYNDFELFVLSNAKAWQALVIDLWRYFCSNRMAIFFDGYKQGWKFKEAFDRAKKWRMK